MMVSNYKLRWKISHSTKIRCSAPGVGEPSGLCSPGPGLDGLPPAFLCRSPSCLVINGIICMCICLCVYIHIYVYREREINEHSREIPPEAPLPSSVFTHSAQTRETGSHTVTWFACGTVISVCLDESSPTANLNGSSPSAGDPGVWFAGVDTPSAHSFAAVKPLVVRENCRALPCSWIWCSSCRSVITSETKF